jgi:alpha-N-arabinofuranosidase
LIEEIYNLEDALVVAGFLNSFIRHADVVKIANLAQIVNVIAPILTRGDDMLIQSIFYPFEMFSRRRNGISLRPSVHGPEYTGKKNGAAPFIDTSAILDGDRLHVFAVNRSLTEVAPVEICLADRSIVSLVDGELLTGPDAKSANSFEQPDLVKFTAWDCVDIQHGRASLELPPLSLVAFTLQLEAV